MSSKYHGGIMDKIELTSKYHGDIMDKIELTFFDEVI